MEIFFDLCILNVFLDFNMLINEKLDWVFNFTPLYYHFV